MYKSTNRFKNSTKYSDTFVQSGMKTAARECRALAHDLIAYEIYLSASVQVARKLLRLNIFDSDKRAKLATVVALGGFEPQGSALLAALDKLNEDACKKLIDLMQDDFRAFASKTIECHKILREVYLLNVAPEPYQLLKQATQLIVNKNKKFEDYRAVREWLNDLGIGFL